MKKISALTARLFKVNDRIGQSPLLISIRRGLTYMIPLLLLGSIALIFLSLPIPEYQRMMAVSFGPRWKDLFGFIRDGTFNILSLIMVLNISYCYAVEYCERNRQNISPIITATVALCSFIALLGISRDEFALASFGPVGIFAAIVAATSSSVLFVKLSTLGFLRIQAFTGGANAAFQHAVTSIYPAAITITCFALLNQLLSTVFGIVDIQQSISGLFSSVFSGIESPFWGALLFILMIHVFWFFGMHGSNILEPVAQSLYIPALKANEISLAMGQPPQEITTKTFFDAFVLMGGCGATLCLILAILIFGKHKNQRRLAKMSLIPVIFNINELMVFGVPIVLNPVFLIPFLCIPVLLTATAYGAMYYGLVPLTHHAVEWTTPVFLSGYISTGSLSGSFFQAFNLMLGTLCYLPFVRLLERMADIQMQDNLEKVYALFRQSEEMGMRSSLLTRHDDIGTISRFLAADLEHDLCNGRLTLFYQPQVEHSGRVFGIEALLRWKHDAYGYIYPPLIIALAEESRLIDKLGSWIVNQACADLKKVHDAGLTEVEVSINISALQLENNGFTESLEAAVYRNGLQPRDVMIEITERLALSGSKKIIDHIKAIKALGIKLAMDDFGMGHSSLLYLKEYDFDTVKLDGSLVREILSNSSCSNIISSIMFLGESLNYTVIAEYVENADQRERLHGLGCDRYQGYHYSKALPFGELVIYLSEQGTAGTLESARILID